ncbi:hypothetical protein PVAP13_3NG263101 [Panicum virgatum]|uniref:Uncharacterized protein n=1 Tax=Panicum virgatum TaxID=38727 RepID=A0A8T0UQD1_PANVG|nr:hypothetical protein PVAP13_3NG263101 [Panicum virgatum]
MYPFSRIRHCLVDSPSYSLFSGELRPWTALSSPPPATARASAERRPAHHPVVPASPASRPAPRRAPRACACSRSSTAAASHVRAGLPAAVVLAQPGEPAPATRPRGPGAPRRRPAEASPALHVESNSSSHGVHVREMPQEEDETDA